MKRIATTVRCVPRFGFENTDVRAIDVDLAEDAGVPEVREALERWFAQRGIADALYDIQYDDNGLFAIVNDDAFTETWGTRLV